MSLLIGDKLVVSMHYTLTDDDKNVLDTSAESEPMSYLHGADNIIPGLEDALTGKVVGDKVQVHVEAGDGYGETSPELIHTVDIAAFQGVDNIEAGMKFETESPDGHIELVEVKEVDGDKVIIDANHPLAGVALNFDVEIIDVREATPEELDHGHVH